VRRGTAGGCGRPGARSGRRRVLLLRIHESGARDARRAVRRDARGGRDGVARRRRDTRGAHRDEDSDTVGTARRGRGEGCGRRRRALRRFSSNRRQKLFPSGPELGEIVAVGSHIDAAVGHGRRRRRPLQRPRRHGPRTARYTRGNPDKLDVTLTRHAHSRRSSHARV
jgi:hypothetical protein